MIKIETKKIKVTDEFGSEKVKEFLIVNGIPDEESFLGGRDVKYAHFYNENIINTLTSKSFKEIGGHFNNIGFGLHQEWWENWIDVDVYCNTYYKTRIPCIKLNLQIQEWEHWAKPWSISSVAKQFEINVQELSNDNIQYWQEDHESVLNGFGIEYYPTDNSLMINDELSNILTVLDALVDKTNKNLLTSLDSEAVITYFQFPEEVKTVCKQYLAYFTQFIADMGIVVDTELKEELNHTLFKIVPKNKTESLDRIREALSIYLNAPSEPSFQREIANQTDIAAKQWEANYYHLKSQISLVNSIIQAKNATIETLQLSNYQYRQLLESHTAKKESEKEEVIKGIIAVKNYEGKGYSINFAELFRRLKRIIKQ